MKALAAAQNDAGGSGRHKTYGNKERDLKVNVHMRRTKSETVNIFTSTVRPVHWLEADAVLRRKRREYRQQNSLPPKTLRARENIENCRLASSSKTNDNKSKDGYRPYVPGSWLVEELEQRLSLSEGKAKGEMSSHYGHLKAATRSWRALGRLYGMISNPQYASENILAAASVNDALRSNLRRKGTALAMDNLAPLHWVAKDHFLCLLFAYYKFSPFEAHGAIGAVHDTTLAERPWIERMLFKSTPFQAKPRNVVTTTSKGLQHLEIFRSKEARQKHRELLRMGTAVVTAVREDTMVQFSGIPIADTRPSGRQHVLKLPPSPTKYGSPTSMLSSTIGDGIRPHIDDSLRVQDRRKPNTNPR